MQAAAGVEDDGDVQDVAETGYVDENGELKRPWCPQTRILEHREMVRTAAGCIFALDFQAACAGTCRNLQDPAGHAGCRAIGVLMLCCAGCRKRPTRKQQQPKQQQARTPWHQRQLRSGMR